MSSQSQVINFKREEEEEVKLSIPELISYLQGKLMLGDFEMVKQVLLEREEEVWLEMEKHQRALDDSSLSKSVLEDECRGSKREIEELKEQVLRLREENRLAKEENSVMKGREKRGEKRYEKLKGELKKQERSEKEKVLELQNQIKDLECGKKKAECTLEIWKRRYGELNTRVLRMEEEITTFLIAEEDEEEEEERVNGSSVDGVGNGNSNLDGGGAEGCDGHAWIQQVEDLNTEGIFILIM